MIKFCNLLCSFRVGWKILYRLLDGPLAGSNYNHASAHLLLKQRLPLNVALNHVILLCVHHRLSRRCTSTFMSSASCIPSTLCCQLTFRKSIFDFCNSVQNHPRLHQDASKNRLFLPPLRCNVNYLEFTCLTSCVLYMCFLTIYFLPSCFAKCYKNKLYGHYPCSLNQAKF